MQSFIVTHEDTYGFIVERQFIGTLQETISWVDQMSVDYPGSTHMIECVHTETVESVIESPNHFPQIKIPVAA